MRLVVGLVVGLLSGLVVGLLSDLLIGLVVGLPVHLDGNEGSSAAEARSFGKWLSEVTKLPCTFWDERFTTIEAESALWSAGLTHKQRKVRRDRVAAQMLLQAYLDAGCNEGEVPRPIDS